MTQYYLDDCPTRQKELDYCIRENLKNPLIHTVHIFYENNPFPSANNIKIDHRVTYNDYFEYANKYLNNCICVIINTDIVLDESLSKLQQINWNNIFLCITRHDVLEDGASILEWDKRLGIGKKCATHDAWMFMPPVNINADMSLGLPGCDGRLVYLLENAGYNVHNPAGIIKIHHYHRSNKRNYGKSDVVRGKRGNTIITDKLP